MATMFVKPAAGRRVLNHQRGFLPLAADGEMVESDASVRRWLRDGDAVEADTADASPAPAAAPEPKRGKPAAS